MKYKEEAKHNIKEPLQMLQEDIRNWENNILQEEELCEYGLTPVQELYLKNADYSGILTPFKGTIDFCCLRKAFIKLLDKHFFLRSTLTETEGDYLWKVHRTPRDLKIPYIDISHYEKEIQQNIIKACIQDIYLGEYQKCNSIFYRVFVIKKSTDEYIIGIPMSHIIVDAISGNIITADLMEFYAHYLNDEDPIIYEGNSYIHYLKQIKKGPIHINDAECIEKYSLDKFYRLTHLMHEDILDDNQKKMTSFRMKVNEHSGKTDLVGLALKYVAQICSCLFSYEEIPLLIVDMGRVYENHIYDDLVGPFIDLVPCVISKDQDALELRHLLNKLLDIKNNCNINFFSFISNRCQVDNYRMTEKYISEGYRKCSIIFNYMGRAHDEDEEFLKLIYKKSKFKDTILFNIKVVDNSICIDSNMAFYVDYSRVNDLWMHNNWDILEFNHNVSM